MLCLFVGSHVGGLVAAWRVVGTAAGATPSQHCSCRCGAVMPAFCPATVGLDLTFGPRQTQPSQCRFTRWRLLEAAAVLGLWCFVCGCGSLVAPLWVPTCGCAGASRGGDQSTLSGS
ncbi:hypothetical protein COO60DRAFT_1207867 [Scenedesmus sp. NREL 46B-D3]|nr:hypothetical protein COO60DRAFT_1207867 [Scenedesmus sp. NREL 46B-D3]